MAQFRETEYGFTDIFGIEWTDAEVDAYNRISEEIAEKEAAGRKAPEWMLDARHRQYCTPRYCEEVRLQA